VRKKQISFDRRENVKEFLLYVYNLTKTKSLKNTIDILNGKHPQYGTCHLKNRLLLEGYKTNTCEICGISDWNGKALNMQLHHKDGNCRNHSLNNLEIICPNCHAQTDSFCGKNK